MRLVPATVALARAEIEHPLEFTRLLGATVPQNWPPESLADALPLFLAWLEAAPDQVGWFGWYALRRGPAPADATLVGSVGFKGPPRGGTVEIGYSVLPQFRRRGYAAEMVGGLTRWALSQPGVSRVIAEAEATNLASVGVLLRVGFAEEGPGAEPGSLRYELFGGVSPA
jgi:RimJ/RimL family protein N-acetyltransferase